MRILVSNDDGYAAPGITALADALRGMADVVIVAPERNRSGASNSLTLDQPLRLTRLAADVYCVDGTPADCIHVGLTRLFREPPDLVVSGVNNGENLGDDVLYSGTVAAAMEGCLLGCPGIAVSLAGPQCSHYATGAGVAANLVRRIVEHGMSRHWLLNVNVPDRPSTALAGVRVTRLGQRQKSATTVPQTDPKGRELLWIGPSGPPGDDAGPGTDFHAVAGGYVSITPLQTDLTAFSVLEDLAGWIDK